LFVIVV